MILKTFIACVTLTALAVAAWIYWPFGDSAKSLRLPGTVEVQEVRLGSKIGGRVAEVAVSEGYILQPGQILARFEVPELEAQRQQLEGRLRSAEADMAKAKYGNRSEEKDAAGATVEAALARWKRLKAGPRAEEIKQARADVESAEADARLARQKFDRVRRLVASKSATPEESDTAKAAQGRTEAQVGSFRARLELLLAGTRKEDIDEAAAELKRVRANFALLEAGTRTEDLMAAEGRLLEAQGKLREVEVAIREAVVKAPERAVVEVLAVRKGDLVQPNQTILRVLRADDLWVKVYVPETQLGKVSLGQAVEILIDSHADRRFTGTVMQIAGTSEFTPRNVQSVDERRHQVFGVKIRVANPDGVFKSGMAAEVLLPLN